MLHSLIFIIKLVARINIFNYIMKRYEIKTKNHHFYSRNIKINMQDAVTKFYRGIKSYRSYEKHNSCFLLLLYEWKFCFSVSGTVLREYFQEKMET